MAFGLILLNLVVLSCTSWSQDVSLTFRKYENSQCLGADNSFDTDILRDFAGTADECQAVCVALEECAGFIRVNQGAAELTGNCYFRRAPLQTPFEVNGDDRDCYERLTYVRYEGQQCEGSEADVLRNFVGEVDDCIAECSKRIECVGFIRVNSGSQFAGRCFLRGGELSEPMDFTGDDRDCYEVIPSQEVMPGTDSPTTDSPTTASPTTASPTTNNPTDSQSIESVESIDSDDDAQIFIGRNDDHEINPKLSDDGDKSNDEVLYTIGLSEKAIAKMWIMLGVYVVSFLICRICQDRFCKKRPVISHEDTLP